MKLEKHIWTYNVASGYENPIADEYSRHLNVEGLEVGSTVSINIHTSTLSFYLLFSFWIFLTFIVL